jgi:hypothetical protein
MGTNDHPLPHARANDIVIRELPDELLVYDLKNHKAHCLNKTAAAVWKYCDGKKSVAELALLVEKDLNTTVDEAAIWLAIERLSKANLLKKQVTVPAGSPRLGRREAMRRLGLGSTLAVPVVLSILAPTAHAACTVLNNGSSCSSNAQCCSGCCSDTPGSPGTTTVCVTAASLTNGSSCSSSCACQSACCKSNGSSSSGQNTCVTSGPGNNCY